MKTGFFLQDAKYVPPCTFHAIGYAMCNVHWVVLKECLVFFPQNRWTYILWRWFCTSPQFWLEMSVEWRYNFNAPWHFKITYIFRSLIFQLFHRGSCFSWDSYPRIPHLKSNSVPAELPSNLVMSGKPNIWSCNHNIFSQRRLQMLNVLLPLVLVSVGNCRDMYLLVRILRLAKKFPLVHFHHEIR